MARDGITDHVTCMSPGWLRSVRTLTLDAAQSTLARLFEITLLALTWR